MHCICVYNFMLGIAMQYLIVKGKKVNNCGRQNHDPLHVHVSIFNTHENVIFYGRRHFADVINLRILRWNHFECSSKVTRVFKEGSRSVNQEGFLMMLMGAEVRVRCPGAKRSKEASRSWKREGVP